MKPWSLCWLLAVLTLAVCPCAVADEKLQPVSLQLLWKHQFQFAGYYAAQEKGFYREAGLDVSFREANPDEDVVENVLKGESQFGVGNSSLMLYRAKGLPVVVLGVIFQHSPLALLSLASSGIHNIHQIVDKRVMIENQSAELFAYLKREGISQERLEILPHNFSINELVRGSVDVLSVYTTDEPRTLDKAGIPYSIFSPRSGGIDFYGDNFFTSADFLRAKPQVVRAFREASLKGWEYAMSHPHELADLIIARYGNRKSRDELLYEHDKMLALMRPDLVAIGYMYPGRWRHIADVYAELGMIPPELPLAGFIYEPDELHIPSWVLWAISGGFLVSLAGGGITLYILRINRLLSREILQRQNTEISLKASQQHYQAIYETAPLALIVFDQNNLVSDWNRAAESIFGWPKQSMVGQNLDRIVPESQRDYVYKVMRQAWEGEIVGGTNYNLTRDGKTILCRWSNVAQTDGYGNTVGVLSLAEDITETQRMRDEIEAANFNLRQQIERIQLLQGELREQALHDPLTNLYNRRYFHELLEREVSQCQRDGNRLSLIMIDIDYFKKINDTFGHLVGDEVLIGLAGILTSTIRRGDSAFRFGGEEFVLILPGVDTPVGLQRAESIRRLFADFAVATLEGEVRNTLSAGIATWPVHAGDAKHLLGLADKALYAAKEAGRNRCLVSTEGGAQAMADRSDPIMSA